MHHALLEIDIISGKLVCPETGREFAIRDGVVNMLAREDELPPQRRHSTKHDETEQKTFEREDVDGEEEMKETRQTLEEGTETSSSAVNGDNEKR